MDIFLADAARRLGDDDVLSKVDALIDWSPIAARIKRGLKRSGVGPQGYGPLVLSKCLLIGQWHGLSDPKLERALKVRLDFMVFCGLNLHSPVPDETTHCRFRNARVEACVYDDLLAEVCLQLEAHGLKLREAQAAIIDATLNVTFSADAHACLATINEQFKITLKNTHPAYQKIFALMEDALKAQARPRFLDLRDGDPRAVIEVPFWAWQDQANDILEALHAERESDELLFTYPLLREVLPLCRCIVGGQNLEIEPIFPPSDLIKSFAKAKRRIYMTATLSGDSVLSTHFAADANNLKPPIVPKSSQSMGERMILVPQDTNADLEFDDIRQLLVEIAKDHNVVVIVPSDKSANLWKDDAQQILTSKNIVGGVDKLREGHVGLTVLINRYDGIDLPGKACRVLAIFDLPEVTSFREAADHAVLSTTDATLRRQIQRIEQGMGRGVRSNDDHCVVLLCGAKLAQRIKSPDGQAMLTSATRAQMGLSGKLTKKLAGATIKDLRDVPNQCLDRDKTWIKVSKQTLLKLEADDGLSLDDTAIALRSAFDFARADDPIGAETVLRDAINAAEDPEQKAWLKVRLAEIKHMVDPAEAQKVLASAHKTNSSVLKPIKGVAFQKLSPPTSDQAARVQTVHRERFIDATSRVLEAKSIIEDLTFDPERTNEFEAALDALGRYIGLSAQRPEKKLGEGPDNLWAFYGPHYFVIEAKSGTTSEQGISKTVLSVCRI